MITAARFFGGARLLTLASSATARVHPSVSKVWCVKTTGSGTVVCLPKESEMRDIRPGRHVLAVHNVGSHSTTVEDANGDSIGTVAVGEFAWISLLSKSDNNGFGSWLFAKKAVS